MEDNICWRWKWIELITLESEWMNSIESEVVENERQAVPSSGQFQITKSWRWVEDENKFLVCVNISRASTWLSLLTRQLFCTSFLRHPRQQTIRVCLICWWIRDPSRQNRFRAQWRCRAVLHNNWTFVKSFLSLLSSSVYVCLGMHVDFFGRFSLLRFTWNEKKRFHMKIKVERGMEKKINNSSSENREISWDGRRKSLLCVLKEFYSSLLSSVCVSVVRKAEKGELKE